MAELTSADLLAFIGDTVTAPTTQQAEEALRVATAAVESYCRGAVRYQSTGELYPGLREVILASAARVAANPLGVQFRDQAGAFSISRQSSFQGFTLAERFTLNRYRRRAR